MVSPRKGGCRPGPYLHAWQCNRGDNRDKGSTRVCVHDHLFGEKSEWRLLDIGNGKYHIQLVSPRKGGSRPGPYLHAWECIPGDKRDDGSTFVCVHDNLYGDKSEWRLIQLDASGKVGPNHGRIVGTSFIESVLTGRYAFDACKATVDPMNRGSEGGWNHKNVKSARCVDGNYYDKAMWRFLSRDDGTFFIEAKTSNRFLLDPGEKIDPKNRGAEGGWVGENVQPVVTADANYNNRAIWRLVSQGDKTFVIENEETHRYLFCGGSEENVADKRGKEGGWVQKTVPDLITVDANYYNRVIWKISGIRF